MSKMCQPCASEETTMDEANIDLTCSTSCRKMCDHGEGSSMVTGEINWLTMDSSPCSTPYGTPIFSRENSFSSFASCFSSLGDSLTDSDSEEEIELHDTGQFHHDNRLSNDFMEQEGSSVRVEECQFKDIADDCTIFSIPVKQYILSAEQQLERHEDSTKGNFDAINISLDSDASSEERKDIQSDDQLVRTKCGVPVEDIDHKQSSVIVVEQITSLPMPAGDIFPLNEQVMDGPGSNVENAIVYNNMPNTEPELQHGTHFENDNESLYPLVLPSFDADPHIWLPPEPENKEDEFDTVSNDDDESGNNSNGWGRASFKVNLAERNKESHEDQLQKVMSEVMNGQFKILVSRFLDAEGLSLSDGGTDKNWLDIVVSLSWDAALLVKPDANSGNAMDPGSYVKVKCIASGSYQQSEVINGLVFKKSAAHKQMRANVKHPKLLLLQGALGHSSTGLSSINSMKQENDQLERTLYEVIIKCQPDVILVEKAVSRNVNEYIQKQGVTVVSDMNTRRLERIARCIGSPIISLQSVLTKPSLIKQCESLHFEKFVEEHNITGEDGKKLCKTFLFLEGFPRSLGCTILLKGATREELKKIKRVLHFTVFAAYHLILETSFFADQKLFTTDKTTIGKEKCFKTNPQLLGACYDSSRNNDTMNNTPTCDDQYPNQEKLVHTEKSIPSHLHDSKTMTSEDPAGEEYTDSKGVEPYSSLPVSDPSKSFMQDMSSPDCAESNTLDAFDGSTFTDTSKEVQKKQLSSDNFQGTFDVIRAESGAALNNQDILISMSSQHIRNQAVCEQSHLSRITYYGYFDTSLGRYLQDTLLNEKHSCLSCGESPESHMYSYTHHNGTLTVLVKRLPLELTLSGETQGRIWMWTRCLRCNAKPTHRVIISSSARNLSFGKFLELSFSTHSAAKKLPTCGHLLHRDCLRFFGFGSKVAMFRYSSVEIYSACKPPLSLEFNNRKKKDWLDVEVKNVLLKWSQLFTEIENAIQDLRSRYSSRAMGEVDEGLLLEVSRMLTQEKNEVEVSLREFSQIAIPESFAHGILGLNWLYQQLILGFYIWDLRLLHILQYTKVSTASSDNSIHESTAKNELKSSGSIAFQDTPSVKKIETERKEAIINSSGSFDDPFGDTILDNVHLTDKLITKEHDLPIYQDHDVRSALSSLGEAADQFETSMEIANDNCSDKSSTIPFTNDEQPAASNVNEMHHVVIPSDDAGKWVWNQFNNLEMEYKNELQGGSLCKFYLINKYTPCSASLAQLKHQMDLGHFIAGRGGNIFSISEEEVSSIIAYALIISEQQGFYSEAASINLDRNSSMLSSMLSPNELENNNAFSRFAPPASPEESTSGFYDLFLSSLKDLHHEIDLNSGKIALRSKYTVVSIYAKQFHDLRKICCPSELAYIASISRCKNWNAQGGKSKVFFAKSMDDRFIIKQIKKTEFDSFLKFGLEYFKHFGVSQVSSNPTCLAKILGIYQVKETRNGKETRVNFMVMENLLFGRNILRRYDLKGALFSRYIPDSENPENVLLDQNFIEDMRTMPIYIEGKTKKLMERAIWNDTSFLSRMTVMDYSLLVGVDKEKKELVFGIIDYLRQYTLDKQLESWVKTSLVVPKNLSPTVISPRDYKIRFRAFMSQHFLSVPDA